MRVFCRQAEYRNNFEAFENNLDRNSKNPAKSGAADCVEDYFRIELQLL